MAYPLEPPTSLINQTIAALMVPVANYIWIPITVIVLAVIVRLAYSLWYTKQPTPPPF